MIAMAHQRPAGPQQAPAASAPAPQPLPRGGGATQPVQYRFQADEDGVYESDEEEPAPALMIDPRIVVVGPNTVVPVGVLLQAGIPSTSSCGFRSISSSPTWRWARTTTRASWDARLRATTTRTLHARTRPSSTKVPKFTGLAPHGDNLAELASGVASRAKVKRRGLQAGTTTDQKTRPPGWWQFIPLTGMGPKGVAHTRYIMGHLLNKDFGGFGHQMYNLSVFSSRLNSHHKVQVENPLRDFLKGAAKQHTRKIDYTVTAVYGNPANMVADATAMFDAFLQNHRAAALAAWVKIGLIDATDVPNLTTATATDKVALKSGKTWDVVLATARAEIAAYVTSHFPESVVCRARMYDHGAAATDWDKTAPMDETIQHLA